MNFKTTLILLVLLAVVVPAAIILPKHLLPTDDAKAMRGRLFPHFKTDHASRLELERGGQRIVCAKGEDGWHIVEPLVDRADEMRVRGLLSAVEFMTYRAVVRPGVDPAQFGLDSPETKLTVSDGTRSHTIYFGNTIDTAGSSNLYVSVRGDDNIYCIDAEILKDMGRGATDFRSRSPLNVYSHRVNRLEMTGSTGTITLSRKSAGWRIESPVDDKAGDEQVRQLMYRLIDAEKQDFVADGVTDFTPYGLHEPEASVGVWSDGDEQPAKLQFGAASEDDPNLVYANVAGEDSVFTLPRQTVRELTPPLITLRERRLASISEEDITEMRIERGATVLQFRKEGFDWLMTQPKQIAANTPAIRGLKKLLVNAVIQDWIDDPGDPTLYDLDEPTRLSVTAGDGDSFELQLGGIEDSICYARIAGRPAVLKLSAELAESAVADYLAFRTHRMLEFPRSKANSLHIAFKNGFTASAERVDPVTFRSIEPAAGPAEMANVNNILWDLSSYDAETIVSESVDDFAPYGLHEPEITVTLELGEGGETETHTILIGSQTEGGFYSRIAADSAVFIVRPSIVRNLCMSLLSLRVSSFDIEDVRRIEVSGGERTIACERQDEQADWTYATDTEGRPEQRMVNALVDELQVLRAIDYVDYQPESLQPYGLDEPALTVRVSLSDDNETVLHTGRRLPDGRAYARTESMTPIFIISRRTVDIIERAYTSHENQ